MAGGGRNCFGPFNSPYRDWELSQNGPVFWQGLVSESRALDRPRYVGHSRESGSQTEPILIVEDAFRARSPVSGGFVRAAVEIVPVNQSHNPPRALVVPCI